LQGCNAQPVCTYTNGNIDYLKSITCFKDYKVLQGSPLTEKYGQVQSVKLIYQIKSASLYFAESKKYPLHYTFCEKVLKDYEGLAHFNEVNYKDNYRRNYILSNLNYYSSLNVYCIEFFNGDEVTASQIKTIYDAICKNAPILAPQLKILLNTPEIEGKLKTISSIPGITVDEIYSNQKYQSLNKGKTFGYLRIVDKGNFNTYIFNKHDIVVTNTIPNILPVVAGIITVPFQTPLCHIALLCKNRGTPNAAYRYAFTDKRILELENQLVEFWVDADSFTMRPVISDKEKISADWKKSDIKKVRRLAYNTKNSELQDIEKLYRSDAMLVGGKAANLGELNKIRLINNKRLPLPEGAFAIPFFWYKNHLTTNGIQLAIDSLVADPDCINSSAQLKIRLKNIQKRIKNSPLDPLLVHNIKDKITRNGLSYSTYRFRSSTNAEDIKGFNGAGLYTSKSVILGSEEKSIEKAIRQVWASLWDERAFAERAYFNLDQSTVFMAILVHRAFGTELANGVALTKHLYRENYPSYTINAQWGETSVVSPPDSVQCDQMIVGLGAINQDNKITFEFISKSNISGGKQVLSLSQVGELVEYLTAIKKHFFAFESKYSMNYGEEYNRFAMDVEFKIDTYTGKLYIKQARNF